ncbi:alpha/beta hydrolase [Streptomyces cacaoi]|uniref:alpha/beta hydrolase n=1 Tax=Streptomyces cacaoi TaxID=1898 RepID=UPI003749F494
MDDAEAAFNWLLSEGYEPGNIITIGHSIGGFIAVALALRLRDKKQPLPSAIVSISPWCDLEMRSRAGPAIAGFLARPETITRGRAGRSPPGEARARACMPPS